ncbi:MAG: (Fe-S)-binding protein, partial [Dehalococcoidia bacterium]|nr:(Fe-S)-binding protein [Dehalococcoidia bacterium]
VVKGPLEIVGVSNFSIKQRVELDACTRCGECLRQCEAYGQRRDEAMPPAEKVQSFKGLLRGEGNPSWLKWLLRGRDFTPEQLKELSEETYRCTLCARCVPACPVKIDLLGLWKSMRAELVNRHLHPANFDVVKEAIAEEHNVLNYPNDERASWVDYMLEAPDDLYQRSNAEVVYYVGCMSSFSPAAQSIPEAFVQLLTKLGIDFTIMGSEEWCCGFPLIAAGMPDEADKLKRHNVHKIKELGAKMVVFTCPSCYNTWTREYSQRLPGVEMVHSTELLDRWIAQGKIRLRGLEKSLIYHDPCDLGRNSGVYEQPRRAIKGIPGVTLVEAKENRENAHCCGGGGDLEITDANLTSAVAQSALSALQSKGAEILITACPQCKRTFKSAQEKIHSEMKMKDIVELFLELMEDEAL